MSPASCTLPKCPAQSALVRRDPRCSRVALWRAAWCTPLWRPPRRHCPSNRRAHACCPRAARSCALSICQRMPRGRRYTAPLGPLLPRRPCQRCHCAPWLGRLVDRRRFCQQHHCVPGPPPSLRSQSQHRRERRPHRRLQSGGASCPHSHRLLRRQGLQLPRPLPRPASLRRWSLDRWRGRPRRRPPRQCHRSGPAPS